MKNTYCQFISAMGHAAIKEKRALGEAMHLAPLGYRNARDAQGRSMIVPDPQTYELVQEAHELSRSGMSIRAICRIMNEKGLRSRRGKLIGPSSMFKVLREARLPL